MKMTDMGRTDLMGEAPSSYEPEPYDYGLCLVLDDDQCEKLGIKTPPAVGTRVMVQASALVKRSGAELEEPGESQGISLSLQIIEMGVSMGGVDKSAAEILYGKKE